MKKIQFLALSALMAVTAPSMISCSNDDKPEDIGGETIKDVHFDVWVTAGTSNGTATIVKSVNSLSDPGEITFANSGCDVTATLDEEIIVKGQYYYEIPQSGDGYGKYRITNQGLETIARRPFGKNTYRTYRYTHAWLGDGNLLIMSSNGDRNAILWTKLNPNDLSIIDEGTLDFSDKVSINEFTTSGLVRYRKSDNKLIYLFYEYGEYQGFYAAFIDASSMKVENVAFEQRAEIMAGSAYGELLQNKMAFDNNDNLYIIANSRLAGAEKSTCQYGRVVRINRNETDFDKSYLGFRTNPAGTADQGKLLTVDYMGDGKLVLSVQDPHFCGVSSDNALYEGWGNNYNVYYCMLDIATDKATEFKYDGQHLPYSEGNFAQRSLVLNGKVYIGTNPKDAAPTVYVYDIREGTMVKGATIQPGYGFDRIVYIQN